MPPFTVNVLVSVFLPAFSTVSLPAPRTVGTLNENAFDGPT